MKEHRLDVLGYPAPQGSKKAWVNKATGRAQMREQSSDRISLWRQDVKGAVVDWMERLPDYSFTTLGGPLALDVTFYFPRPRSHYGTGRNAERLRDNAPNWPTTRAVGDIDKLLRATCDAMVTAGMFADDSQVVAVNASKGYADERLPGAAINVRELDA